MHGHFMMTRESNRRRACDDDDPNSTKKEKVVDPLLLVPKSTLILKPISNGVDSKNISVPLILVPTAEAATVVRQPKRRKTQTHNSGGVVSELPRPNWSKKRFIEKIRLMKGPSPYDLHHSNSTPEAPTAAKNIKLSKTTIHESEQHDEPQEICETASVIEPIVNLAPGFSIAEVETNSTMCFYYTGFDSHIKLKELFERLNLESPYNSSLLSLDMEFLLCMTKLRKNKDFEEMGFFFNISSERAQEIFEDWIHKMYDQFEQSVFWVSQNYIIQVITQCKNIKPFDEEFLRVLKNIFRKELKRQSSSPDVKFEEYSELIHHAKKYQILNQGPIDDSTTRLAAKIAHICLSIANYHLYPNYMVLLS